MIVYTCPECGSDLQEVMLTSYPPQRKMYCNNCNWSHIETDKVYKVPYKVENESMHAIVDLSDVLEAISNPKLGGSV